MDDDQATLAREMSLALRLHISLNGAPTGATVHYDVESKVVKTGGGSRTSSAPPRDRSGERAAGGHALAVSRSQRPKVVQIEVDSRKPEQTRIELWTGEDESGPSLRRSARMADRVLVVIPSGGMSFGQLNQIRARVGRDDSGLGYVVVGVPEELTSLADRVGPVARFWRTRS
jgi:hypothetical protein